MNLNVHIFSFFFFSKLLIVLATRAYSVNERFYFFLSKNYTPWTILGTLAATQQTPSCPSPIPST